MQLVFVDRRDGTLLASEQPAQLFDSEAVEGTLEHIREWAKIDPHIAAVAKLPVGVVYDSERSNAPKEFANHPFYQEHWAAYQNRGLLAAKVLEEKDRAALFGVIRSWWHPAFNMAESRLFSRYVVHLQAALQISKYVERLRGDAIAGRTLMDAAGNPILLLEFDRRIITVNAAAKNLLDQRSVLSDDGGVLTCCRREDAQLLFDAVTRLCASGEVAHGSDETISQRLSARTAIRLNAGTRSPLLCSLWRMNPESTMAAFGRTPSILLSIATSDAASSVNPNYLGSLFNLTPAEARVSLALRPGISLAALAAARHVAHETIRAQLRSIYAKTGTHSRAELLQLLERISRP